MFLIVSKVNLSRSDKICSEKYNGMGVSPCPVFPILLPLLIPSLSPSKRIHSELYPQADELNSDSLICTEQTAGNRDLSNRSHCLTIGLSKQPDCLANRPPRASCRRRWPSLVAPSETRVYTQAVVTVRYRDMLARMGGFRWPARDDRIYFTGRVLNNFKWIFSIIFLGIQ